MKRIVLFLCTLLTLSVSAGAAGPLYTTGTLHGHNSENQSWNHYDECANSVFSNLYETPEGNLVRAEYSGEDGMMVEVYSPQLQLLSKRAIHVYPELYGGFFCGEKYNFLVLGKVNGSASDENEALRVLKYDKEWKRLSSCSLIGGNTVFPFDLGSLRMTEAGDRLYIHTCHTTYPDGETQANMTLVMNQDRLAYLETDIQGYVSPSLNQFIQTDGTTLFRADHGGGSPQSVVLSTSPLSASITDPVSKTIFKADALSLGGFALSGDRCLSVGSSTGRIGGDDAQNIFLCVTGTDLRTTKLFWLTGYHDDSGTIVRTPHLVKLKENGFLILWEEDRFGQITTRMVTVDGSGRQTSQIGSAPLRLSDCPPIVTSGGKVCWYVSHDSAPTLYTVDPAALVSFDYNLTLTDADPAGGQITLQASGLPEGSSVLLSSYQENGTLLETRFCTVTGGSAQGSFTAEGAKTFKCFVLDGLDGLSPLRYSKTLSIN